MIWNYIFDLNFKHSEIIICGITKNKDEVMQTKTILLHYLIQNINFENWFVTCCAICITLRNIFEDKNVEINCSDQTYFNFPSNKYRLFTSLFTHCTDCLCRPGIYYSFWNKSKFIPSPRCKKDLSQGLWWK